MIFVPLEYILYFCEWPNILQGDKCLPKYFGSSNSQYSCANVAINLWNKFDSAGQIWYTRDVYVAKDNFNISVKKTAL